MKPNHRSGLIALAGLALAVSSCSTTTGGRSPSGFLGNYKQLDAGYGSADAVSAYLKPGLDLKKFDSVIIDPVTTVVATPGISPKVTDQLAAYLGEALRSQVAGKMKVVKVAGPHTLRVRTALTDIVENRKPGTPVTTVHTNPRATLTGNLGSAAVASFVANVSFEGEILDSVSGERLSARCDHRLAAKREATAATPWTTVRANANQGAARFWQTFMEVKGR
jgi:hypothetical protein